MSKFFRAFLAVLIGLVIGSVVNMGLVTLGGKLIQPPAGADVTTMEGLKTSMHLFEARHFLFPFLAHALGTVAGAFIAAALTPGKSMVPPYVVGACFLLGGITSVVMLPAPAWFSVADLLLAYLPCAWLGARIAARAFPSRAGS